MVVFIWVIIFVAKSIVNLVAAGTSALGGTRVIPLERKVRIYRKERKDRREKSL